MVKIINHTELLATLKDKLTGFRTQNELAAAAGVSPQYLTDVLHGRRDITGRLLDYLGFKRVRFYERV